LNRVVVFLEFASEGERKKIKRVFDNHTSFNYFRLAATGQVISQVSKEEEA
jgi:hypothetical protein